MDKINFTTFFKEEKDIYIQNVAHGQVSFQFGRGDNTVAFTLTRKRDPIVLTNRVPFKMIAESTDFRKTLSRHPAVVKLLSEEEYNAYYKAKAKQEKITVDEAINRAESSLNAAKTQVAAPTPAKGDDDEESETETPTNAEDVVNARVIHLCHQASEQVPQPDRMKPADLLAQLKDLQGEFKLDDYEYILANTKNKIIHTWAKGCQKDLAGQLAEAG